VRVNRHTRTSPGGGERDRKLQAGRATHEPKKDAQLNLMSPSIFLKGQRQIMADLSWVASFPVEI
jgi:hypothetical protein